MDSSLKDWNIYHDILFHGFKERLGQLEEIKRFNDPADRVQVMFYRNNLADHSAMVASFAAELMPYAVKTFPASFPYQEQLRCLTAALVHDDPEAAKDENGRFIGDKSTQEKLEMSLEEFGILEDQERQGIEKLADNNPENINGFNYRELMLWTAEKSMIPAQYISYCDKLVGLGEALHEIFAGNTGFLKDGKGRCPAKNYLTIFANRYDWPKWNLITPLFNQDHPLFETPDELDVVAIANHPNSKPHTMETIYNPTGCKIYDAWKQVILQRGGQRGLELLIDQKEFPKETST